MIRALAVQYDVGERVIFIDGGKKLAQLLDRSRTAVTVNSTAAQQALWRGLPVAAMGRAIYRKPGLASEQDLAGFFRCPGRPDLRSYWLFRQFLMETSQITGSFYAKPGIERTLSVLPAVMLERLDPYDRLLRSNRNEDLPNVGSSPTLVAV